MAWCRSWRWMLPLSMLILQGEPDIPTFGTQQQCQTKMDILFRFLLFMFAYFCPAMTTGFSSGGTWKSCNGWTPIDMRHVLSLLQCCRIEIQRNGLKYCKCGIAKAHGFNPSIYGCEMYCISCMRECRRYRWLGVGGWIGDRSQRQEKKKLGMRCWEPCPLNVRIPQLPAPLWWVSYCWSLRMSSFTCVCLNGAPTRADPDFGTYLHRCSYTGSKFQVVVVCHTVISYT